MKAAVNMRSPDFEVVGMAGDDAKADSASLRSEIRRQGASYLVWITLAEMRDRVWSARLQLFGRVDGHLAGLRKNAVGLEKGKPQRLKPH
jgi:hypothetical protein